MSKLKIYIHKNCYDKFQYNLINELSLNMGKTRSDRMPPSPIQLTSNVGR